MRVHSRSGQGHLQPAQPEAGSQPSQLSALKLLFRVRSKVDG
jgi:hypothetical protein